MAICPRCKSQDTAEEKSWDVIPKTGKGAAMRVTAYKCSSCGGKFRKAVKLDRSQIAPTTSAPKVDQAVALPEAESASSSITSQAEVPSPTTNMNEPTNTTAPQVHHTSLFHRLKERFHR
ncbi:MAG: hypothetical protein QXJ75_04840 [Candidatus Bathyarchaeia archaeon]